MSLAARANEIGRGNYNIITFDNHSKPYTHRRPRIAKQDNFLMSAPVNKKHSDISNDIKAKKTQLNAALIDIFQTRVAS